MTTTAHGFGRRTFLSRTGLAAAGFGALAGGVTLSGCSEDAQQTAIASKKAPLPAYVPQAKSHPDLPAIAPTGTCGYKRYPTERFSTVSEKPLASGTTITAVVPISAAPPVQGDRNVIKKLAEKKLGGTVRFTAITESDYGQRFNTTIAGGDLPDVMFFQRVASYADLLQAKFADLTEHLAGDAIKDYPNLANIPSAIWEATAVGDKLFGLPLPRNGTQGLGLYHKEMFDKVGGYPKTADEFLDYLKELTRPDQKRWGMVSHQGTGYNLSTFTQMFGAPLNWRKESDGSLIAAVATDEYRAAVDFARKCFASGVYHPNSNGPNAQVKAIFNNGQAAVNGDTVTALLGAVTGQAGINPKFDPQALAPISHDGSSDPVVYMDFLSKQFVVLKKASGDKIKQILRLANFLAAPLGSDEELLLSSGVEGKTFTFDDHGQPQLMKGFDNQGAPWGTIAAGPMEFFDAEVPATVVARYNGTKILSPALIKDPTATYYSATQASKGATLNQKLGDVCTSVIAGRSPMADFDKAVKAWKSGGGDKIKEELETAMGAVK